MTYTAFDGQTARLCVASSTDLVSWTKHGLAFSHMPDLWSKSGSIVTENRNGALVACRINGRFWMYWGESSIFVATSSDLIHWDPVLNVDPNEPEIPILLPAAARVPSNWRSHQIGSTFSEKEALMACMRARTGRFDSALVEPGPPAVVTDQGILLIYNGKNSPLVGDRSIPHNTYCVGQALFDLRDPTSLISRETRPTMMPETDYERTGQVGNVCFAEGLVQFQGSWLLYYGTADSSIAVARAPIHDSYQKRQPA